MRGCLRGGRVAPPQLLRARLGAAAAGLLTQCVGSACTKLAAGMGKDLPCAQASGRSVIAAGATPARHSYRLCTQLAITDYRQQ